MPGRLLASGWWLLAAVAIGAALRVAHVLALRSTPWFDHLVVDPEFYDAWARRIAAGDWIGDRPFYMDPLYPYVLAALYRLWGRDLLLARLLNVGVGAVACLCIARLGRRVGGPAIGGLAALGFALYKPDVFYAGEVDKTALSVCLVAAALALFFEPSLPVRFATGVVLALAVLTRANLLVFLPLAALAFLLDPEDRRRRVGRLPRALLAAVLFAVGATLVLFPVAWRNHHVGGEWVLTTSQAGQNFYTGNNPTNPYGAYGVVPFVRSNPHFEETDFRAEAEARAGRPLSGRAVSAFWFREALAHVRAEPAFAARAFARKLALFWNDFEISDSQDQYLLERDSPALRLPLPGFGAVAPLALLGALAGFRARRAVRVLCVAVVAYCLTVVAFFVFSRYRIQVVPALLPLAALGAREVVARLRARALVPAAVALAIVATGAVCSFRTIGLFSRDHPAVVEMRLRHLADIHLTAGSADRAIAVLHEAVAGCPRGCPSALGDLFRAYVRTGRLADGETYFGRFLARHPAHPEAVRYLESLRAERGARAP
jgi:4-amino-4-deoxy-L-arabinose transferase-like glycosyltransferase